MPSISARGQIRLKASSLSAGYMIAKSSVSKVSAAGWRGASGRCMAGDFERRNGSAPTVDGLADASNASPHMLSGDGCVCGQWCRQAFRRLCAWLCHSAALILKFPLTMWSRQSHCLLDGELHEQSDLSCPWNSWCCVMYSAVDSFFHSMNFNNFFSSLCAVAQSFFSVFVHCWILFHLLPSRSPITTCPVEKQSCETQPKKKTVQGMSISSNGLKGGFFSPAGGRLGGCQTWDPTRWGQPVLSRSGRGRREYQNGLKSPQDSCLTILANSFQFTFNPYNLTFVGRRRHWYSSKYHISER